MDPRTLYFVSAECQTREQLLEHRARVTETDPLLPHRAGTAYQVLARRKDHEVVYGKVITKGERKDHRLVTHALVRPKPDYQSWRRQRLRWLVRRVFI